MVGRDLIPESNIQVVETVKNWEEAVRLASLPLLKSGNISDEYVDNMIDSVNKNGPYMVLSDYFALMHARPGQGVKKLGMSLLVLKHETDLRGKPVKIFLVLAATDNQSHLESLQQIMGIFMDDGSYRSILTGNRPAIVNLFDGLEK
ncbi:PTS sugar transporter subunit IIA [Lacticaseibacillus pantheris]|uniref:PTS sugar transporter subunit IIA n=1 Tax=Lacticaseibacillus pantheris TaxID=171523 RepID=UPI000704D8CB|nr:PTS sugar transporter subunit IIA [Lacticaseibacillus pantheris]